MSRLLHPQAEWSVAVYFQGMMKFWSHLLQLVYFRGKIIVFALAFIFCSLAISSCSIAITFSSLAFTFVLLFFAFVVRISLINIFFIVASNFLRTCDYVGNIRNFKLNFIWIYMILFEQITIIYVLGQNTNQLRGICSFIQPSLNINEFLILFCSYTLVR